MAQVQSLALTPDEDGLLIAQSNGSNRSFLRLLTHDGELLHIAGTPEPSYLQPVYQLRPSVPCPVGCNSPVAAIGPQHPFDTMPGLAPFFEDSEDPAATHHVRAEWSEFNGLFAVAAHRDRIHIGGNHIGAQGGIRVIEGLRGGPIYAFRAGYAIPEEPPYPCGSGGCSWQPTTDMPLETVNSLHVDDDGAFFTTSSSAPRLARAQDDLASPIETILGGPDAGTLMCATGDCDGTDDVILGRDLRIGVSRVARGPDGSLYVADAQRGLVYRVARAVPPMYVSSWLNSEDGSEVYRFDDEGRHLETRDSRTHELVWSFQYDEDGFLVGITDRFGDTTTIARGPTGQATSIVGPDQQTTLLGYDANGYLDSITDPTGAATEFVYTDRGLMRSMSDSDSTSEFDYDGRGHLTNDAAVIAYAGSLESTAVQTLDMTEASQNAVEVEHTSAEGVSTLYHRERTGPSRTERAITWPDDTQTTAYEAPEQNGGTYADGTNVTVRYDVDLRLGLNTRVPTSVDVAVAGVGTSSLRFGTSFTPHCQLFTEDCDLLADPGLRADEIVDTVTEGASTWTETFRRAHVEGGGSVPASVLVTTPLGRSATTTLNDDGDVATVAVADLAPVSVSYDSRGRVETVTQTNGADTRSMTVVYDAQGFVASTTDALERTTSFLYDEVGRVERQTFPDGRFVVFAYDDAGNVTSVTPPGQPTHDFAYDSLDRLRSYDPPVVAGVAAPQTTYAYDADHRPVLVTRPDGQALDLDYDPTTGHLELVTTPTGAYDYAYDPTTGQLATVADPDGGTLAYAYAGPLVASETISGDVDGSVSWTYDNRLRLLTESVNGAQAVTIAYDLDGVAEAIGALTLTTDPVNGQLATTSLGSVTTTHDQNDFGQATHWAYRHNGSTLLYDLLLTHDEVGRIQVKTETRGAAVTIRCYEYDEVGRIADVYDGADSFGCTGAVVEHYGYDTNGNRNEVENDSVSLDPADLTVDDQDRLLEYGDVAFSYTENGEVETMTDATGTTNFVYDASGNLQSIALPDGVDIAYVYDARDRRVGKRVDGVQVQGFLYGDQLDPIAELDGTGAVVSRFVYGTRGNVPDYMLRGGNTYRIISDQLGSVVAVVDVATGAVAQEIAYDTAGRVLSDSAPGFQPFGFAGGVLDHDTGWVLFGARDYQPETGRWAAKDGLGFAAGDANLYRYVGGDAVNFVDPDGLWRSSVDAVCSRATAMCREAGLAASGAIARVAAGGALGIAGARAMIQRAAQAAPTACKYVDRGLAVAQRGLERVAGPQLGRKLEYFLGNATGSAHNVERSTQMQSQLIRIGLPDNAATRQLLTEHLARIFKDPSSIGTCQRL
jgi:RHS repeat-associated protein